MTTATHWPVSQTVMELVRWVQTRTPSSPLLPHRRAAIPECVFSGLHAVATATERFFAGKGGVVLLGSAFLVAGTAITMSLTLPDYETEALKARALEFERRPLVLPPLPQRVLEREIAR